MAIPVQSAVERADICQRADVPNLIVAHSRITWARCPSSLENEPVDMRLIE